MAAYYYEIISPIYERNQNFESFKMAHNFKFCHILFNVTVALHKYTSLLGILGKKTVAKFIILTEMTF